MIQSAASLAAPPPDLTVDEWADRERRLSAEGSPEPGQWNTDRVPYLRGIMRVVTEEGVREIAFKASSQVGKTEFILNALGYFCSTDPCPILCLQPTLEMAEAFSKERLAPMIRDTPALAKRVTSLSSRDGANSIRQKRFKGGYLVLAGANSPASLASRPVRVVLCDEIDRYPESAGNEGDPIELAKKRTTAFHNALVIKVSTPTIEGRSKIAKSYDDSDQREFELPCPLCRGVQVFDFKRLRFDREKVDSDGSIKGVTYQCAVCEQQFDESRKAWQLLNGVWVARSPFQGIAGFRLNELYSPFKRWGKISGEFLEASKDASKLQVWVNTALGETWKTSGEAPKWERLYERRESYPLNELKEEVVFLTAAADVQKDRIEVEIVGWMKGKRSQSIDYRVFLGDTAGPIPWAGLEKLLFETWKHPLGAILQVSILAVDSGYNTQSVYSWARNQPRNRVMVVKGVENQVLPIGTPSAVDAMSSGREIRRGLRVWPIGVSALKHELYAWLELAMPVEDQPFPSGYCHFPQYDSEYFQQLTAEQVVKRVVRGYTRHLWEKIRDRNEALDVRIYNRAAAILHGIDRFSDEDWQILSDELKVSSEAPEKSDKSSVDPDLPRERKGWLSRRRD